MARTDTDSWDLASSVGATATMVATARALATVQPDAIINDPYAAPLVREVGIDFFTGLIDGDSEIPGDPNGAGIRLMTDMMAVRTRFFDDFFIEATGAGIRQAVILASGLDARAYRLPWTDGTVVYEIDQPQVIEAKTGAMAKLGATPTAELRTVAADLREDWPAALRDSGFDVTAPSAWSAEGLLMYLPPDAQDRLFDNITALSAPGSRIATEFHGGDFGATLAERAKDIAEAWRGDGFDLDFSSLFYGGERNHVVDYLGGSGWCVHTRNRLDVFADYGRTWPFDDGLVPLQSSVAVTAIRDGKESP
jgi:methyltransferase (TIGR00027 family)